MRKARPVSDSAALDEFVKCVGSRLWSRRLAQIEAADKAGRRSALAMQQRYAIELAIERLRRRPNRPPTAAEKKVVSLASAIALRMDQLNQSGQQRLRDQLAAALGAENSLVPICHLMHTALQHGAQGFDVAFPGLEEGADFDLVVARQGVEAEIICDVLSAEEGRRVHRSAWFSLADRIDPDLTTWLNAHPGRYLLKMTLPQGLRADPGEAVSLSSLHERIRTMLHGQRRADHDEAAVLRLDPLLLAGAQAADRPLLPSLREEFGPEAHLSVTTAGQAVFVMAARAGSENDVAGAVHRRMATLAPSRLSGTRPGILAMFIEDTDRAEWQGLRDSLVLEGEARQFLTQPAARSVVAVTCTTRLELFGADDAPMRFRNPSHPAAKTPALAPAVLSSN
jgi:hypothetical protein